MEVYQVLSQGELFLDPLYSLASVVNWITPTDKHWAGGIQYDADCTEVSVTAMTCISGAASSDTKEIQWSRLTRGARAFDVYTRVDCTPDGDWWDSGQRRALRALKNSGPTQLERTFQTGASGVEPALILPNLTTTGPILDSQGDILLQPAATIISGTTPLDVVEGLGRIEAAFSSCYDGRGVVHVPMKLGAAFAARNLCYKEGNKLYTYAGNTVVFGSGYADVGPGGVTAASGTTWIFMTSPIFGIRGTPRVVPGVQALNRGINTLQLIAEQKFLLAWECCLIAALVTTGGEWAGAPGTPLQAT